MKRFFILIYFIIFGLSLGFAQSGKIIDDIYVTPNDAQMVQEVKSVRKDKMNKVESQQSTVYRNGAREIVFIDQNGNRTTAVSDTVYIVDGEVIADSLAVENENQEDGYYLNGFKGSKSDLEYAERIRRFHNPKYTITIADPGYNDIYFLDDNYWNVYVDGMYATITPTWNNPYWFNYQYSPYSYGSWGWRSNWGYPYYSGFGSYYGWGGYYDPWYYGYNWGGFYDPWYSSYYGWGYPYYGGYYGWGSSYYGGWGYPYYGGYYGYPYGYGYGGYYGNLYDSQDRRGTSRGTFSSPASGRRTSPVSRQSAVSAADGRYTSVSTQRGTANVNSGSRTGRSTLGTNPTNTTGRSSVGTRGTTTSRSSYSPDIDTRTRTGAVRSTEQWNQTRSANTSGSSSVINRSNPSSGRTYDYSTGRSSTPSRTYESTPSRSSDSYSTPSRSSSSSSGSYSSGSSRSSGGSYSGSSGGSYGGSSSSGGGRSSGGSRR